MKIKTLVYNFKQGMTNIYRNKVFSIASIGTITACLFLFGIFYFVLENVKNLADNAQKRVSVTVFFDENTSADQKNYICEKITERSEVEDVVYISQEEAWEKFKNETFSDDKMLGETFGDENPLEGLDSYEVKLNDASKQDSLVSFIESLDGVKKVNYDAQLAKSLFSVKSVVAYFAFAIMLILLIVSIFLISITVLNGITVRTEEIKIMKLIGATDLFIKTPFIFEGIVIGMVGAIIPILILFLVYEKIIGTVMEKFGFILPKTMKLLSAGDVFKVLVPVSILIGVGIGIVGTVVTLKRKLNAVI